jgi:nitroimidazol reductase NimA-like FMN-containing flavoprotein (pyridoxamine 5'-phosphate oxidase superfamily)
MEPLPEAVRRFVAGARVCRIAGVRPDGEPHAIPVCPVFDGEATVYVDIGPKYTMAEAVRDGSRIAALIDEYDDDWSRLKAVLLRCNVEEATGEEKERAWAMIRAKFPQHEGVGWEPRLTLALHVYDWRQWGIV